MNGDMYISCTPEPSHVGCLHKPVSTASTREMAHLGSALLGQRCGGSSHALSKKGRSVLPEALLFGLRHLDRHFDAWRGRGVSSRRLRVAALSRAPVPLGPSAAVRVRRIRSFAREAGAHRHVQWWVGTTWGQGSGRQRGDRRCFMHVRGQWAPRGR